jgi:hypothetical protein
MNQTGATATITMPKEALDLWDLDENGLDVVWFFDGARLFAVPKSSVGVTDGDSPAAAGTETERGDEP